MDVQRTPYKPRPRTEVWLLRLAAVLATVCVVTFVIFIAGHAMKRNSGASPQELRDWATSLVANITGFTFLGAIAVFGVYLRTRARRVQAETAEV